MRCELIPPFWRYCGDSMSEKNIKSILRDSGLLEMIDGQFISPTIIARIIPDRKKGIAVVKDKHGNRIGILRWSK